MSYLVYVMSVFSSKMEDFIDFSNLDVRDLVGVPSGDPRGVQPS